MYLLLAILQICAAAARLAKIRICNLSRSVVPACAEADAFGHSSFHFSLSSSPLRRWVLPTGNAGLTPSHLHIANAA